MYSWKYLCKLMRAFCGSRAIERLRVTPNPRLCKISVAELQFSTSPRPLSSEYSKHDQVLLGLADHHGEWEDYVSWSCNICLWRFWSLMQLIFSVFKTLTDQRVTVELKNDLSITGVLKSVDQYVVKSHQPLCNMYKFPNTVCFTSQIPKYSLGLDQGSRWRETSTYGGY